MMIANTGNRCCSDASAVALRRAGALPRAGALSIVTLLIAGAGCSGGGSNDLGEFLGRWSLQDPSNFFTTQSSFLITCPPTNQPLRFELWTEMVVETGTLTDLVETAGVCQFNYDLTTNPAIAAVPNPDPFTAMAPSCRVDASDATTVLFADIFPTSWEFRRLAPEKGKAPHAQVLGSANVNLVTVDVNGMEVPFNPMPCTYNVGANLTKIARD